MIEFFDDRFQGIFAEDAGGDGQRDAFLRIDALPGFQVVFLFVGGKGAVEGDGVFNDVQPVAL